MIDLIDLITNLFESFDKHFLPYFNKKLRAVSTLFKQDFLKKMLILHMEENKKILEKINSTTAIKNALEKNGVGMDEVKQYETNLRDLHAKLQDNNLKIEALKGKISND